MRYISWLCLPIVFAMLASSAFGSEGVDEVIRLQQGGVGQRVMMAFVDNSTVAYDPSSAEIQKMEDAGVPATVIVAMIDHGKALRNNSAPAPSTAPARSTGTETVSAPSEPRPYSAEVGPPAETVVYAPPKEEANISFFYTSLAPYGEWHRHSSYGWVWQPRVVSVDVDWRPYAHGGHWVWTDHGWYWESTYPWGWAAFHYGRWHRDEHLSWVWVPDTTWGPSWVSWRQSDEAYAWAPLPPEAHYEAGIGFSFHDKHVGFDFHFGLGERDYSCVPTHSFLALDVGTVVMRPERVHNVYNKTTIINNTYVYNDNRIINNGISNRDVATRTNTKIETVTISDSKVSTGQPIRGEVRQSNTIVAYRPAIARTAPKDPPAVTTRVSTNSRTVTTQTRVESDAESRLAREKAVRLNTTATTTTREVVRDDEDGARRRLGQEKQRREAETGESRKVVNREVQQEHQDDVAAEREARRKLNDEKSQRDSEDRGRGKSEARRVETSDKRDSEERSSRGKSEDVRRDAAKDDDDDGRGKGKDKEKDKGHKSKK